MEGVPTKILGSSHLITPVLIRYGAGKMSKGRTENIGFND